MTTIFTDGQVGTTMETSGNLSAWTSALSGNGGTTPAIDSSTAHHGTYSGKLVINTTSGSYSLTRKVFASAYSALYVQAYVYIDALPASNTGLDYIGMGSTAVGTLVTGGIYNSGGTTSWSVYGQLPGWQWQNGSGETITTGSWFCLKLYVLVHASTGQVKLWVNDTLKVNLTGINTSACGNVDRGDARLESPGASQASGKTVYFDCFTAADADISSESSGVSIPVFMHHYNSMSGQ